MTGIDPKKFYSNSLNDYQAKIDEKLKNKARKSGFRKDVEPYPDHLLGPTQFWAGFPKQLSALNVLKEKSKENENLSLFVEQDDKGFRHFVVAHPEVYWWYYRQKKPESRCSYEVIPENEPCRLYFDLEFRKSENPQSNGPKMTSTLIEIFNLYILTHWMYSCRKTNVINLDSTTDTKFSRHLIFNMQNTAFTNNFHIGVFVKKVCSDLMEYLFDNAQNDILKLYKKEELKQLIVNTEKGKRIFVDTAVYSRNRHFRILGSTKWGKQSFLQIAPDSTFKPYIKSKDKELRIFLDSLISYFPDKKNLKLLDFNEGNKLPLKYGHLVAPRMRIHEEYVVTSKSQYPSLDKFINRLVEPGKIRACKYNEKMKMMVYEVSGNRYCRNIGRSHKSNNIYWVVDLKEKIAIQKCHDEDCSGFASEFFQLPEVVKYTIDEEEIDKIFACLPD